MNKNWKVRQKIILKKRLKKLSIALNLSYAKNLKLQNNLLKNLNNKLAD